MLAHVKVDFLQGSYSISEYFSILEAPVTIKGMFLVTSGKCSIVGNLRIGVSIQEVNGGR